MSLPGSNKRVTFAGVATTGTTDRSNRREQVTPSQAVEEDANDIRDSVRRSLVHSYANSPAAPSIQDELEEADARRASSDRVSVRREYSPVITDRSIMNTTNAEQNKSNSVAIDRVVERIRDQHTYENNPIYDDVYDGNSTEKVNQSEMYNAHFPSVIKNTITTLSNLMQTMQKEISNMQQEMRITQGQIRDMRIENRQSRESRSRYSSEFDMSYGRTESDIRHRRSTSSNFLTLKEARVLIPEFDGTSRHKLQDFLNSCTYAIQNIDPIDEESLVQAILFTKLRGKARQDFETRNIQTYQDLKQQLESCYQAKQSTTHLQIEFNSIKQKTNETAQEFGHRVDRLARNLYDSMTEGDNRPPSFKQAIHETIQKQALINFETGLRKKYKSSRSIATLCHIARSNKRREHRRKIKWTIDLEI